MQFLKIALGSLAHKNYHLTKLLWKRRQARNMGKFAAPPIINYQMGKVGSSTVQASLLPLGLDAPIYHVHFLNPVRVEELESERRKYFGTEKQKYLERAWLYEFLYEQIRRKDRPWRLITLVRDPVARNISTFFENLEVTRKPDSTAYRVKSDYYRFDMEVVLENMQPLVDMFFSRLAHERPLHYFDSEIRYVFGIDVFADPFPKDKGYKTYHQDAADLLLIRLEDLNRSAGQAFQEFLGINNFSLVQTNVASEKIYASLYKAFKTVVVLPEAYLDKMYSSKYARHFYSEDELEVFRRGWMGKV